MKSRVKSLVSIVAAGTLVIAGAGVASAQAPAYTFTKVHYPGAIATEPSGINNAGQIVGTYRDANNVPHGFMFDGTNYFELGFPGASRNWVFGISPSGEIVGSFSISNPLGPFHAFLTDKGQHVEFDYPGAETDGRAMNSFGHVVGIYNHGIGTPDHGFLKVGDTYTSIDFPGATYTYVFGLNDAGVITGTYRDALLRLRGFSYINGVYTSISFPGASETYLGGLNNAGTAVGWSIQGGVINGYVFSGGKSYRALTVPFSGASETKARAINDLGEIVGTYVSPECQGVCGFVARPNPGGTPACSQAVSLHYAEGVLGMGLNIGTSIPTTSLAWLFVNGIPFQLWSVSLPVLSPPFETSLPIPLAPSGIVYSLHVLTNASGRIICADYAVVNTGTSAAP